MDDPDQQGAAQPPARNALERQLRIGLLVVQAVAALILVYAVVYVALAWGGDGETTRSEALQIAVVFLVLPGLVLFFTARSARRRLTEQAVSARLWSILAGVFAVLAGLPLVTTVFGLVSVVAGLFTLTAALLLKKGATR